VVDGYELEARDLIGPDFWPYGIEKNRSSIETLLRYSHEQGLTPSRLSVGDIFPHFV
jgi:4,5-dihydroxyphthalate decarboxylase